MRQSIHDCVKHNNSEERCNSDRNRDKCGARASRAQRTGQDRVLSRVSHRPFIFLKWSPAEPTRVSDVTDLMYHNTTVETKLTIGGERHIAFTNVACTAGDFHLV